MSADTSEVAQLAADLLAAPEAVRSGARKETRAAGLAIETLGKINAPVDTGHLRNSIGTDVEGGGERVIVGPTAEYGPHQEFGTRFMRGRHYMGRAADSVAPQYVEAMARLGVEVVLSGRG